MKKSLKQQSGMSFIGLVFVLAVIAMVVLFVLRLFPLYNEKYQVEAAMNTVVSQPDAASRTLIETRSAFLKALTVTNIRRFTSNNIRDHVDIVKPTRSGEPPMLHVQYQATNTLFADIELLLTFDRQIPLNNSGSGD